MKVHLVHGVVTTRNVSLRTHRLCVSKDGFVKYLRSTSSYVNPEVLVGKNLNITGQVLTVDDSTRGGAEACFIARELGHEVLLFVNPEPIVSGAPYFFSLFDAFFDARQVNCIELSDGNRVKLDSREEVRNWWWDVRSELMLLDAETAVSAVRRIGESLVGCSDIELPEHLKPLTCEELLRLRDAGVQIENHGWSHIDLAGMTTKSFSLHLNQARKWIREHVGISSEWYASPFGRTEMPKAWQKQLQRPYFLADPCHPCGAFLPCGAINRRDITGDIELA